MCYNGTSAKQTLKMLYEAITMSEVKGYMMLQFIMDARNIPRKSNWPMNDSSKGTNRKLSLLNQVLASADGAVYKCDANARYENSTYVSLHNILEGVFFYPLHEEYDDEGHDDYRMHDCEDLPNPYTVCGVRVKTKNLCKFRKFCKKIPKWWSNIPIFLILLSGFGHSSSFSVRRTSKWWKQYV